MVDKVVLSWRRPSGRGWCNQGMVSVLRGQEFERLFGLLLDGSAGFVVLGVTFYFNS